MLIKDEKNYLEAKNAANEEQHNEDQAHITKSSNLFFVGEVIGLHGIWKNIRGGSAQYWDRKKTLLETIVKKKTKNKTLTSCCR